MYKKIQAISFLGALGSCTLSFAESVSAAASKGEGFLSNTAVAAGYKSTTDQFSMAQFIGSIIAAFLTLVGVIFLVLTIYAGYLWMTAGGEEKKIEQAQSYLKNGVIGMVIALAAAGITKFVMDLAFKAL